MKDEDEVKPAPPSPLAKELMADAARNQESIPPLSGKVDSDAKKKDKPLPGTVRGDPDSLPGADVELSKGDKAEAAKAKAEAPPVVQPTAPVTVAVPVAPLRPPLSTVAPAGAPPCPACDPDAGDKTRDYFVWQCRYGDLDKVIAHYAGRTVAGQHITEETILKVRKSRD